MNYTKPALSFEQQAQRLLDRGLLGVDKKTLVGHLTVVNYYRLSAYWYPFKIDPNTGSERFAPGTTFEMVWRRYIFDRQLRLLIMDAVEYVEVAILRTRMVEQCTLLHGPFGYCDINIYQSGFINSEFSQLMYEVDEAVRRSNEEFVERFQGKYTSEPRLPLWMAVEVMTFGQLFTLFRLLDRTEQKQLVRAFDLYLPVLLSWLKTINYIRNVCAHHGRLWNRELPIRPIIPDKKHHPEFYIPQGIDNRRVYAVLALLRYLLRFIDPQNDWQIRLEMLLQTYPDIPLHSMGFPADWKKCPIWM
ncbi:MAG: Abi family protein [Planctomycetes bacterium]|nr:Abi family protein [Planctomycetota bacterium]